MRFLVFLLVLCNVGLFAYFNMDRWMPKAKVVFTELNSKKINVLTEEKDFEKLTKKQGAAYSSAISQPLSTCYHWGDFTAANLAAAQVVLVRLGLQADVKQTTGLNPAKRFWVYYPPLPTEAKAKAKADEIKRLGVEDLYIVQGTKWRNAISFGLFSEEPLAVNLLKELKSKGVRNAVKALRSASGSGSYLLIKDVSPETALRLYKIKPEFVGTEVTPTACPASV